MKTNKYWLSCVLLIMGITSCKNDLDINMVNDTIGLMNPDMVTTTIYPGVNEVYNVQVIKSGKGQNGAQATLTIDKDFLNKYNSEKGTNYSLMPSDCYSLTLNTLDFSESDYQKAFTLKWNVEKLQAVLEDDANVAVPLTMHVNTEGVNIAQDRLSTLVVPSIDTPTLAFENTGLFKGIMPTINDLDEREIHIKVQTNFPNRDNIIYEIAVDPQLLEDYNKQNATNYQLLPETAYKLSNTKWTLPALTNETYFSFTFKKTGLMSNPDKVEFGEYVLPIKLVSASTCEVNQASSTILYNISFQPALIEKNNWVVFDNNTCSKEDETSWVASLDWGPEKTIDSNPATFWGSKWTTPKPLPYYFVYDMAAEYKIYKVGFDNPTGADAWRGNAKAGYIEYSIDNENWNRLTDWSLSAQEIRSIAVNVNTTTARYLRFVITEAFDSHLFENGGSQMNIAEFYVWGE